MKNIIWEVVYKGESLGQCETGQRGGFIANAMREGTIDDPLLAGDIHYKFIGFTDDDEITSDEVAELVVKYAQQDIEKALPVVIGVFVGLIEAYMEIRGEDKTQQITLESQRKIVIGPSK